MRAFKTHKHKRSEMVMSINNEVKSPDFNDFKPKSQKALERRKAITNGVRWWLADESTLPGAILGQVATMAAEAIEPVPAPVETTLVSPLSRNVLADAVPNTPGMVEMNKFPSWIALPVVIEYGTRFAGVEAKKFALMLLPRVAIQHH